MDRPTIFILGMGLGMHIFWIASYF